MTYYVYMLECSNGAYYTGYTNDIKRRYQEHLDGSHKSKYTRSFPPIRIAACWSIDADKSLALKIEIHIKQLDKAAKNNLVENPEQLVKQILEKGILENDKVSIDVFHYTA